MTDHQQYHCRRCQRTYRFPDAWDIRDCIRVIDLHRDSHVSMDVSTAMLVVTVMAYGLLFT